MTEVYTTNKLAFHSGPNRIWTPQLTQFRGEDNSPKTLTVSTPLTWEIDPNNLCVRKNSHPTEKYTGKTYPIFCVRIPAVEALREEKTTPIFPVDEQNNGKDANYSAWVLSNSWSPRKCLRETKQP